MQNISSILKANLLDSRSNVAYGFGQYIDCPWTDSEPCLSFCSGIFNSPVGEEETYLIEYHVPRVQGPVFLGIMSSKPISIQIKEHILANYIPEAIDVEVRFDDIDYTLEYFEE